MRWLLRQAAARLLRRPLSSLLAITLVAAVLLLAGVAGTLLYNLQLYLHELQREAGLVVYLAEDASAGRLEELARELRTFPGVAQVRPVPRQVALADLQASLGEEGDLLADLGEDLLPDSLEVTPGAAGAIPGGLDALGARLAALGGVASVARAGQGRDAVVRLASLLAVLQGGSVALLVTMLLLVGWLLGGMAGLGVLARTDEVRLLRLLGASELFIARPFLGEGVIVCSLGGGLAAAGLLGVLGTLRAALGPDAALAGMRIEGPPLWMAACFLLLALLVGLLGAFWGATRAVRR